MNICMTMFSQNGINFVNLHHAQFLNLNDLSMNNSGPINRQMYLLPSYTGHVHTLFSNIPTSYPITKFHMN